MTKGTKPNELVVEVRGGVAEVTHNPLNLNVQIIDHDVLKEDDCDEDGGPMETVHCVDCGAEGEQQNPGEGFEWTCWECQSKTPVENEFIYVLLLIDEGIIRRTVPRKSYVDLLRVTYQTIIDYSNLNYTDDGKISTEDGYALIKKVDLLGNEIEETVWNFNFDGDYSAAELKEIINSTIQQLESLTTSK